MEKTSISLLLESERLYFSIGEVSRAFGVRASLIRFWEKEFDNIKPKKNQKGNRLFTKEDVKALAVIHGLVKEKGFTLNGARKKILGTRKEEKRNQDTISRLIHIREELLNIKKMV